MKEAGTKPQKRIWLAIVGSATLILGAAYAMVQQSTRMQANDLPLATAQTIKHELQTGANPNDIIPDVTTNLASDSTVFAIITDSSQRVLASSARLDGATPLPPAGTFRYTFAHGADDFTWQPANNIRAATQMLAYGSGNKSGYIIAGQSLKQAEARINTYTLLAFAAWVAVIVWSYLLLLAPHSLHKTKA